MEYEVEGSRPRGRPKGTWKEVGYYGSWWMEEADKDWIMIRMVGG